MSLPTNLDISRKRGDTKPFNFTIKDANGADQALAGFVFYLTVNSEKAPTNTDNQQFQLEGTTSAAGSFSFAPTTDDVDLVGMYYYDVQIIDGDGVIYTVYEGKMTFVQDITKETS